MFSSREQIKTPATLLYLRSYLAREGAALIRKAVFVSGRDKVSVNALRNVLRASENPVVKPEEVRCLDSGDRGGGGACSKQREQDILKNWNGRFS